MDSWQRGLLHQFAKLALERVVGSNPILSSITVIERLNIVQYRIIYVSQADHTLIMHTYSNDANLLREMSKHTIDIQGLYKWMTEAGNGDTLYINKNLAVMALYGK